MEKFSLSLHPKCKFLHTMKGNKTNLQFLCFSAAFAILMTLPFIVPHTGFLALAGFLPLLMMDRIATLTGKRHFWIWHYLSFVLWNAATTFWVCNATVGGGLFAIFANSFQMSVIFALFRFSKRYLSGILPYLLLMVTWIAWERAYFDADISWPWLVLGNAFAGSIKSVQWYEYTGTLGGSLWIWLSNLSVFGILVALSDGRWMRDFNWKARTAAVTGTVIVLAAPFILSHIIYANYEETQDPLEVLVVQPNIDPYNKFRAMTRDQQNSLFLDYAEQALGDRKLGKSDTVAVNPLLVLAPETFTNDVVTNTLSALSSRTLSLFKGFLQDYPGVNILFGASSYTYIDSYARPSHTARQIRRGKWIESHNSAIMTDRWGEPEIFHKNKLVVGVEMTPYPAVFCRIDDMLGGVMGRCIGQDSVSVLHVRGTDGSVIPVGCAICYESVYGEYCTGYVKKGAEVMTVITNDAWWGDTPGYRQHLNYARLRAVETRRDIARCANTGISAIIDQRGEILQKTSWWEPAVIRGYVNRNDALTFFVRNGDIAGRVCTFVFWLLAAALVVRLVLSFPKKKRQSAGK